MSECFFQERNLDTDNDINSESTSMSNIFEYFYSQDSKNNLVSIISKIQLSYGIYNSIVSIQELINNLLLEFKTHLYRIGISFNTLNCDYVASLEYLCKEFIKLNYEKIINIEFSSSELNSNSIKSNSHTKLLGTTYDKNGMSHNVVMDTQDMRPEDWQNLNVLDTTPIVVSSNNYRNKNKIPWRQKQGQVRQYEHDIIETLANVRDTESVTYKNTGLQHINSYNRKIPGIID